MVTFDMVSIFDVHMIARLHFQDMSLENVLTMSGSLSVQSNHAVHSIPDIPCFLEKSMCSLVRLFSHSVYIRASDKT